MQLKLTKNAARPDKAKPDPRGPGQDAGPQDQKGVLQSTDKPEGRSGSVDAVEMRHPGRKMAGGRKVATGEPAAEGTTPSMGRKGEPAGSPVKTSVCG